MKTANTQWHIASLKLILQVHFPQVLSAHHSPHQQTLNCSGWNQWSWYLHFA